MDKLKELVRKHVKTWQIMGLAALEIAYVASAGNQNSDTTENIFRARIDNALKDKSWTAKLCPETMPAISTLYGTSVDQEAELTSDKPYKFSVRRNASKFVINITMQLPPELVGQYRGIITSRIMKPEAISLYLVTDTEVSDFKQFDLQVKELYSKIMDMANRREKSAVVSL